MWIRLTALGYLASLSVICDSYVLKECWWFNQIWTFLKNAHKWDLWLEYIKHKCELGSGLFGYTFRTKEERCRRQGKKYDVQDGASQSLDHSQRPSDGLLPKRYPRHFHSAELSVTAHSQDLGTPGTSGRSGKPRQAHWVNLACTQR